MYEKTFPEKKIQTLILTLLYGKITILTLLYWKSVRQMCTGMCMEITDFVGEKRMRFENDIMYFLTCIIATLAFGSEHIHTHTQVVQSYVNIYFRAGIRNLLLLHWYIVLTI